VVAAVSRSEVTPDGVQQARPAGEATTGANVPPGGGGPRRRRRRREPEFRSYYDLPILNKVVWATPDVAGYLFVGGLAGASGVVAGAAHATGRRRLRRVAKLTAASGTYASLLMLIHDLGRPARFLNMLRMVKVTSPMNVGSWLLTGFGLASSAAALCDVSGKAPRLGAAATAGTTLIGPAVATYTAALVSDTAVPAWHDGHHLMPYVFASSALSSAAGWGLLAAPVDETRPLVPLATAAGLAEVALTKAMEQQTGIVKETFESGTAGKYLRAAEALTAGGAALAAVSGRGRLRSAVAGAALLLGSALTRFGIFHAGIASTRDPKYVVVPQRERASS
jgi:formate-dependent nitrite reductase membrane component NrfD